jgi:hypothetical protein
MEEIKNVCMREWSLGKFVIIDEMMVRYKGSYCPVRQYMPKKLEKWGIKFWVLADSASKFIYCFDIYCGKNLEVKVRVEAPSGQGGATYGIVMNLLHGLHDKGPCVVMDNFFSFVRFFRDLASKGIYATCIIRSNCIGIFSHLKNTRTWNDGRDVSKVTFSKQCMQVED